MKIMFISIISSCKNQVIPGASSINNESNLQQRKYITPKENSIVILGDNMVKHVNGWDLAKKMKSNCKVYVKHFLEQKNWNQSTECRIN